jgi:hypothetical protein
MRYNAARRIQDTRDLGDVLVGLEQAVADTRSMARTIGRAGAVADWEPRFRDAWVAMCLTRSEATTTITSRGPTGSPSRHFGDDPERSRRPSPVGPPPRLQTAPANGS